MCITHTDRTRTKENKVSDLQPLAERSGENKVSDIFASKWQLSTRSEGTPTR